MEKSLDELEEENEVLTTEAEIMEKKAKIAYLKKLYGNDWKRVAKNMLLGFKGMIGEPPSVMRNDK